MSKAMYLVGIMLLGFFTLVIINVMSDVRSTSELDYYLLQEITEASMYDAVDYSYYRDTGLLKVDRDLFLENFNRRFATSVTNNRDYSIRIVDFNETPPKVSIEAKAPTVASIKGEVAVLETRVNGILETIYDDLVLSRGLYQQEVIDTNAPTIEITSSGLKNTIKMTDDLALEEYCIAYLPKDISSFDINKASGGFTCYKEISGKKEAEITRDSYADDLYYEWVIVYDSTGNYKFEPLADTKPWIKSFELGNGKLDIVMRDNEKVESYAVLVDTSDYSKANWVSAGTNKPVGSYKEAKVSINAKDILQTGNHNYYIYAKDNGGHVSKYKSFTYNYVITNKPMIIQNDYDKENKKIYLTFEDKDGDLAGYYIYKSVGKPKDETYEPGNINNFNKWIPISGSKYSTEISIIDSDFKDNDTVYYYIWVKDSKQNGGYVHSVIKKEVINKDYAAVCIHDPNDTYNPSSNCHHCNCPHGNQNGSGHCKYDEENGIKVSWICDPVCNSGDKLSDDKKSCLTYKCTCPNGGNLNKSNNMCEFSIELLEKPYSIKVGCSGVWDDGKQEGCFGDKNGQTWNHNDNVLKKFTVDTNKYSEISINFSNVQFKNMSHLSKGPNCASIGLCSAEFKVTVGTKSFTIKKWAHKHQDDVKYDSGILGNNETSGTLKINLNDYGLKNTGNQEIKIEFSYPFPANGLSLFDANVNKITVR